MDAPLIFTICNREEKNILIKNLLSAHRKISRKASVKDIPSLIAGTVELVELIDKIRDPYKQLFPEENCSRSDNPPK